VRCGVKPTIVRSLIRYFKQEQKRGGVCLIQQGDYDGSGATKCVEGESPLGGGGVSGCYGLVSAIDVHELAKPGARDRVKQGNRALRSQFLEYAVAVANEFPPAFLAADWNARSALTWII
jgi:hypothetical protein